MNRLTFFKLHFKALSLIDQKTTLLCSKDPHLIKKICLIGRRLAPKIKMQILISLCPHTHATYTAIQTCIHVSAPLLVNIQQHKAMKHDELGILPEQKRLGMAPFW